MHTRADSIQFDFEDSIQLLADAAIKPVVKASAIADIPAIALIILIKRPLFSKRMANVRYCNLTSVNFLLEC